MSGTTNSEKVRNSTLSGGISYSRVVNIAAQTFLNERERWKLWIPVLFGAGSAVYLGLLTEPWSYTGLAFLISGIVLLLVTRHLQALTLAILAFAVIAAGFSAIQMRTNIQAAPVIDRKIGPIEVSGRVLRAEPKEMACGYGSISWRSAGCPLIKRLKGLG